MANERLWYPLFFLLAWYPFSFSFVHFRNKYPGSQTIRSLDSKVRLQALDTSSLSYSNNFIADEFLEVTPAFQAKSVQDKKWSKFEKKTKKFAKAGAVDGKRIFHSLIGMASILIGLHHMFDIAIINSFADVVKLPTIIGTGMLHVLVGLFGIRRLNFKNKKEAARNAMFWPAPFQNAWLVAASLTEWGQGSNALFSLYNRPFAAFTFVNLAVTMWQFTEVFRNTGEGKTKDTIWFKEPVKNAALVEFSYLIWMQLQMGALFYIKCVVKQHTFTGFMDFFPNMQYLLANLALNTAFFNNLAIFIATLLRYKVISKPNSDNAIVFSIPLASSIFIVWKVLSCFFGCYNGQMSSSFISMMLTAN